MSRRALHVGLALLWAGAGGALLWVALGRLAPGRLGALLGGLPLWPLVAAAGIDLLVVLSKAWKWRVLLGPTGHAGVFRLLAAVYAGGAGAVVLPLRGDELLRALVATRLTDLPALAILGSMAAERLVDACLLLFAFVLLLWLLPLPGWVLSAALTLAVLAGALAAGLTLLHLVHRSRRLPGRLTGIAAHLARGSAALGRPRLLARAAAIGALEWGLTVAVVALVAHAVGVTLPWHGLLLTVVLTYAAFALPVTPAGIGTLEVAASLALPALYGTGRSAAVAFALVLHALLLGPMALLGAAVLVQQGIGITALGRWRTEAAAESGAAAAPAATRASD